MIHLYYPDNENYEKNGDVILLPISCEITAGINRTWQVDILHPIDAEGRWKAIKADAVIKTPSPNGTLQLWRIVQTEKRDSGITAVCDPIFYDAAHEVLILDRIDFEEVTCQEILNILTDGTKFSGYSDITDSKTSWIARENLVSVITNYDRSLVRTYNAEIGFNNYEVQVVKKLGGDYGASVLYGKNLAVDGVTESYNIDGTITRIVPISYNGYKLPELYVDSPLIDNYPFPRVGIISYDSIRLWADKQPEETGDGSVVYYNTMEELYEALREAAMLEYTEEEIDRPTVNLSVDMVLIQNTEEYKDYEELERVSLGDTVRCYNPRIDIDSTARVRSIKYDCMRESVSYVEIGREKRNYFDNVTSVIQSAGKAIRSDGTVIAEQVQGFIDGAMAQLKLQNTIAKKQDVRAIIFEDLDPESPTYGAMAMGTQGLQISNTRTLDDRDWDWTTAATADGIIADTIFAGTISGININNGNGTFAVDENGNLTANSASIKGSIESTSVNETTTSDTTIANGRMDFHRTVSDDATQNVDVGIGAGGFQVTYPNAETPTDIQITTGLTIRASNIIRSILSAGGLTLRQDNDNYVSITDTGITVVRNGTVVWSV